MRKVIFIVIAFATAVQANAMGQGTSRHRPFPSQAQATSSYSGAIPIGNRQLYTTVLFTDTISGTVFNDLGADGTRGLSDPGLQDWTVDLFQASLHVDSAVSDVDGHYFFGNITPGTYTIAERTQSGWSQTAPFSPDSYSVTIADGQVISGKDFGNAANSIIRGVAFYDRNANGVRDSGEGGLTGWTVTAAAASYPANSRSTVTQSGGLFIIDNAVTDSYTISLSVKPNWTQTFPPSTVYPLVISTVIDTSGFDFGAATISDSLMYRTYPPESLLVRRAMRHRRARSRWCFAFTNSVPGANGLHVIFSSAVDTITGKEPFTTQNAFTLKEFEFSGAAMDLGQPVEICGVGGRYSMRVKRWWWTQNGTMVSAKGPSLRPFVQSAIYSMPNTANIRDELFKEYFTSGGMTIGIPRPDAKTSYGWALLPRSHSMYGSLTAAGFTHTGTPRGFMEYKGRPFVGRKVTLTPAYHNNRLVADIIALKFSIAASAIGRTPVGLGELIYEEAGNPLSGLTLNEIVDRTDSNLTFWTGVPPSTYANLDSVIRKIDSAFCGPPDTFYVGTDIRFKGVRSVNDVPFLRPSPKVPPVVITAGNGFGNEEPETFELYQNYPNPFNPVTTIEFNLPTEATVTLAVYDLLGQEVARLIDHEHMYVGVQEVDFDASLLPSGVYFYRIAAVAEEEGIDVGSRFTMVKKMLLLK